MKNYQACTIFIPLLFSIGCLKQKYPTGSSSAQSKIIRGAIVMRDWHGKALEKPEAHVLAKFLKVADERSVKRVGLKRPELAHRKRDNRSITQCEVIREPKQSRTLKSEDQLLSVGQVAFGTSSSDLVPLTEGQNHLYSLSLTPNFNPGIYLASIQGTESAPSFAVKLSMPERMGHVSVDGQDVEVSATAFRKSEPLTLSWDAPSGDLDLQINQMELEVVSENDQEIITLVCAAMEKDLLASNTVASWEIPTNYLQTLNATLNGLVLLKRGQWMKASSPEIGVVSFEGVRIYAAPALISE